MHGYTKDPLNIPITLASHFVDVGNPGGSQNEDALYSDTIPGGTLYNDGNMIRAIYGGSGSNTNVGKSLRIRFGGFLILDTTADGNTHFPNGGTPNWHCFVEIIRIGVGAIRSVTEMNWDTTTIQAYKTTISVDLTVGQILKISAISGNTNDLFAKMGKIYFIP